MENATVVYMNLDIKEHRKTLEVVRSALDKANINCVGCQREDANISHFNKADLVIVVGGDGTFLRAAQYVDKQLMLGVNSYPEEKEGFFTRATRKDFKEKLDRVLNGRFKLLKLVRAGCRINGSALPPALNEYYFGYPKAYHVARYRIKFKGIQERHKSSGIIVGTPAGSHAWIGSAGGKKMKLDARDLQWVVREPYGRRVTKHDKLTRGFVKEKEKLKIISEMRGTGVVVADSIEKEYVVMKNDEVEFFVSDKDINFVEF